MSVSATDINNRLTQRGTAELPVTGVELAAMITQAENYIDTVTTATGSDYDVLVLEYASYLVVKNLVSSINFGDPHDFLESFKLALKNVNAKLTKTVNVTSYDTSKNIRYGDRSKKLEWPR